MCTLVELEVHGNFPGNQPALSDGSSAVQARWAGCKRWVTIPEERGCDVELSALDCVVVEGVEAVKRVEDADEEEWHIPMDGTQPHLA